MLRSHLRMSGRWRGRAEARQRRGRPWLVLRGAEREAVLWNGPVLELDTRGARRLGPDILADPPDLDAIVANLRAEPSRAVGDALLDQRLVAGIGNVWKAESLWRARVSPWRPLGDVADEELSRRLGHAARADARVASRAARPQRARVPACRDGRARAAARRSRSRGQGDANRTAYWCPSCQSRRGARPARNRSSWPCALRTSTALCAASVSRAFRCCATMSTAGPSSRSPSRSTPRAGRPLYEYRPLVRSYVEARAERLARSPTRSSRSRSSARAGGRDLRRRAHRRGRRPARCCGRSCCRCSPTSPMRCGGFDWSDEAFDRGVRRARALAARQAPYLRGGRAARRSLARRAGRARPTACGSASPRRASWPPTGPRRTACCRPGSAASPTGSASSSSSARLLPDGRAARRAGRDRRRRQRAAPGDCSAGRRGPGAVRATRLAPAGDPPDAADRRDRAARRARAARRLPCAARLRTCSRGSGAPRRIRSSRRRSIAGSCRCSRTSRSARSSCAKRCPRCSVARTGCGRPRCGRRCCSARPRATGPSSSSAFAGSRVVRQRRAGAADAVRKAVVETLAHGDRIGLVATLDDALVGVRPRPAGYFAALAS